MTKTAAEEIEELATWLETYALSSDDRKAAAWLRKLSDQNVELQRTLRLARAQLASNLQELADCHTSPATGLVDEPQVLLILESEQDLINQIDEALIHAMAGTEQEDA